MPQDTGGILNLKKPVGSDDIRLQTIGIDLPYNFQKIDDAFTAHQAESAQKHITESGENTNGRYIKFDDGTMICSVNKFLGNVEITTASGSLFQSSNLQWDFPAPFSTSDTALSGTVTGAFIMGYIAGIESNMMTSATYRIINTTSRSPNNVYVRLVAIGRWK